MDLQPFDAHVLPVSADHVFAEFLWTSEEQLEHVAHFVEIVFGLADAREGLDLAHEGI